jgi:hypothetical protein
MAYNLDKPFTGTGLETAMEKKVPRVNLGELCEAMENSSYQHEYFLDVQTGEILFISDYMDDEETRQLKDRIEEDSGRYERIPKAEPNEGYQDMVDFIATVDNERLAELLEVAINGKGAFRRFKDVLRNYPQESEAWFKFEDGRTEERALEWLSDIGISPAQD